LGWLRLFGWMALLARSDLVGLRAGAVELAAAMGSPSVVVGLALDRGRRQMPLAEDQHPVGDLRPGGEHEPFPAGVRALDLDNSLS
jgi:hypothetical protein